MSLRPAFVLGSAAFVASCVALSCSAILGIPDRTEADASSEGPSNDAQTDGAPRADCGDTAADPHNCGRCGHDCMGGDCDAGACQPILLYSDDAGLFTSIAVDTTSVYWTNHLSVTAGGAIMRSSLSGADAAALIGCDFSDDVSTGDGGRVLWTSTGGGFFGVDIWGCDVADCPQASKLVDANPILGIATEGAYVAWTTSLGDAGPLGVFYCERGVNCDIGAFAVFKTNHANRVALRDGVLYWTQTLGASAGVYRCPATGCAAPDPRVWVGPAEDIAADGFGIVFSSRDPDGGPRGSVVACAAADCSSPTVLGHADNGTRVAMDETTAYWTLPFEGRIKACARAGCADGGIVTLWSGEAQAIAVDSNAVYWVTLGSPARVMKIAK